MTITRTILYGRTSLDRSDGRSVDDQLSELRGWAHREHRRVVGVHRDDGISASRFARGKERPGWRAVLDAVDRGECDELALWEGSRGSRDLVEWVRLVDVCAERGTTIVIRGRSYDPRDPGDRRRLLYDAVDAEHESGQTSQRVERAARSRAAAGRPHGRVNYGYRIEYDTETGKPLHRVPDPDTAPVVREIVRRLLGGEGAGTIAKSLNIRGVPTAKGGHWTGPNLLKLARNPAYAGLRTSTVHEVPADRRGTWEPLIDTETHDRLIALLGDPTRGNARTGGHVRYLLAGVARCGRCGGRIRTVSRWNRPRTKQVVTYGCAECFGVRRVAEPVDAYVSAAAVAFLARPDVTEQLTDPGDEDRAAARARVAELRALRVALEKELGTATAMTVPIMVRQIEANGEQLAAAETSARPRHVPTVVLDVAGPEAAARWAATPVGQRREIVRALFAVTIHSTTGRGGAFDPSAVRIERRLH